MDKKIIAKISTVPGVYIFKDYLNSILYIGKATNLKSRVSSYFNGREENRPVKYAISQIKKIETIETDSVLEALILESNLIKKHQPKYNIDLKDDKSFSYAVITKETYPRIEIKRETDLAGVKNLKFKVKSGSSKLKIDSYAGIFGPYTSKKQLETALKIIRKIFPYHSNKQQTEKGCLDYQIGLCPGPYADAISRADYLKNIRNIKMILEGKKKNLVKRLETEMRELSEKHEFEKAAEIRNKVFALNHIRDIALISKDEQSLVIGHKSLGLRIEAYDISNMSGQYAVGSMVVFKNDEPDKSGYRKFKIKTIQGADDVGMMREVLLRRFNNEWPKPDLILLDGGQGHLNMGAEVLKSFGIIIPIVAVAKGPTRKISNFQFLISKQFPIAKFSNDLKNIYNNRNLLGFMMSEAHRFAIGYHRKVRRKGFI